MNDARERILGRLRAAERVPVAPAFRPADVGGAALKGCATDVAAEDLLERFLIELTALGVEHHVEDSADAVRARVAEIVAGRRVLRWDADCLPYGVGELLTDAADGASPRDVQAAADVGVTGCDAAIAETGSLALVTGRGKPRSASLLPAVHVAVVSREQLRFGMGEFFRERAADLAGAANCTFVTGPSRTADIELTLTVGVHGPGRVIVIIGP